MALIIWIVSMILNIICHISRAKCSENDFTHRILVRVQFTFETRVQSASKDRTTVISHIR